MDATRGLRSAAFLAGVALVALTLASGAQAGPAARAAGGCSVNGILKRPGYPSYVSALRVQGVTCAAGVRLVKAFFACRVSSGGPLNGRCRHPVLGFSCREHQLPGLTFLRSATVTCRRGGARVIHSYTQLA